MGLRRWGGRGKQGQQARPVTVPGERGGHRWALKHLRLWGQRAKMVEIGRSSHSLGRCLEGKRCRKGVGELAQLCAGQGKRSLEWPLAERGLGRLGKPRGAEVAEAGGSEPVKMCSGRGTEEHTRSPAPHCPATTECSVSPAAGVSQRLPAHRQGGGSRPSGEQTSPRSEPALTGFMCFRKAASATCPFLTPTQVGDSNNPRPSLALGLGERKKVGR